MDLRHLRYFVAVAEELHFGRAAERVHIVQPALSTQIRDLEDMLGGKLFERNNRSVALTEAGRLFLIDAKATLEQAERTRENAMRALRGELGCVRIGYSSNAAYSGALGNIVQKFKIQHQNIDVQLQELDPLSQLQALETRRIHAGLLTTLAIDIPPELQIHRLISWPLRVVLPINHPLAMQRSISMESIKNERFVVYTGHEGDDGTAVIRLLGGYSPVFFRRTNNAMMVVALASAGQGIGLVPSSLEHVASQMGVSFKPIDGVKTEMDIALAVRKEESEPAVIGFLKCVQQLYAKPVGA